MLRSKAIAILLVLPGLVAAQAPTRDTAPAPARDTATAAAGSAHIRGRVVDAVTGQPIRGATISLYANSDRAEHGAITDIAGRYEIADLAGGRYRLTARTDGYLQIEYGQTRPSQGGRPLVVESGALVENVNFNLPRGGAIAGTLRDERGFPMANTQLRVLTSVYSQGRPTLELAAALESAVETTDDLGAFRFFGLPPGSFYITALPPAGTPADGPSVRFAPTYFPGTTSFAEARRIELGLGESVEGVDLTVLPVRMATISARVLDRDGRPPANLSLRVRQVGAGVPSPVNIPRIAPDGTFKLSDLAPEAYELFVTGVSNTPDKTPIGATAIVRIASGENADVRLTAVPLAVGTGRVLLDSAQPATISPISVQLTSVSDTVPYRPRSSTTALTRVEPDQTFKIPSLPGRFYLTVWELPTGWYSHAVRLNGVDVSDSGIEFPSDGAISGIELELTNRPSVVSGAVRAPDGSVSSDYTVIAFARAPDLRRGMTRYFGTGRPDASGRYAINGLPPGDYLAVALDYADINRAADPEFLATLESAATPFTLADREHRSLDLVLTR